MASICYVVFFLFGINERAWFFSVKKKEPYGEDGEWIEVIIMYMHVEEVEEDVRKKLLYGYLHWIIKS